MLVMPFHYLNLQPHIALPLLVENRLQPALKRCPVSKQLGDRCFDRIGQLRQVTVSGLCLLAFGFRRFLHQHTVTVQAWVLAAQEGKFFIRNRTP